MIKKLVVIGGIAVLTAFLSVQTASAHFFVKDDTSGVKAIFHVTPDHDPIAGEESVISYDFAKTDVDIKNYAFSLSVKSTKAEAVTVPVEVSGNVVLASYTFPAQGFYTIHLKVTDATTNEVSNLEYGQRVSRGETVKQRYGLNTFEAVMIGGVVAISIAAITFSVLNDRKKRRG